MAETSIRQDFVAVIYIKIKATKILRHDWDFEEV